MKITVCVQVIILFVVLGASCARAQQPSPQPRDESISGRVVNEAGQPIPGVEISLEVLGGYMGQRSSTDREGNFKIPGLDSGIYRLYLYAPGYVTQMPSAASPTYRTGDKVDVTMIKGAVITGTVLTIAGDPVVNVQVRAFQIRDVDGNRVEFPYFSEPVFTDDRGYYRIWSLRPGTYLVAAGGKGQYYFGAINPFANDTLTYAPSSTRDTASEIIARGNQEMNVDIHYRGDRGHSVSGKVSGASSTASYNPSVRLIDVETRASIASLLINTPDRSFQLDGIADGEYEINASAGGRTDTVTASPKRINVRGADVTGLDLVLAPTASLEAHINFEADEKLNCGRRRDTALRETLVTLRRSRPDTKSADPKNKPSDAPDDPLSTARSYQSVPNIKGDLRFSDLSAATYRFEIRVPAAGWYLRSLSFAKPDVNIARNGLAVKFGEKISGVTIALTEGGASLRGRMVFAEGETPPPNLLIYLVPAERENADNPLRFFEFPVAVDQTFVIGNIAPGKYWLLAQPAEKADANTIKSTTTDNDFRAKILKAATSGNKEISFKPCERTVDYEFRYASAKP